MFLIFVDSKFDVVFGILSMYNSGLQLLSNILVSWIQIDEINIGNKNKNSDNKIKIKKFEPFYYQSRSTKPDLEKIITSEQFRYVK